MQYMYRGANECWDVLHKHIDRTVSLKRDGAISVLRGRGGLRRCCTDIFKHLCEAEIISPKNNAIILVKRSGADS